jgi:hypothetical protein
VLDYLSSVKGGFIVEVVEKGVWQGGLKRLG